MSQLPLDGLIKSSIAIFMVMTVNQFGYIFDTRKGIKTNKSIFTNSFLPWEKLSFFHFLTANGMKKNIFEILFVSDFAATGTIR